MSVGLVPAATPNPAEIMEQVIIKGDLSNLSPQERAKYYAAVCESVGLNPLTKPFAYITLNHNLTLYATKAATDQLRATRHVDLKIVSRERIEDLYVVTVEARTPDGRTDSDIGAVAIGNLKGEALANALMKAVTKGKRRVTLAICGLGMLDETETETIPGARFAGVDPLSGEAVAAVREVRPAPTPVIRAAAPGEAPDRINRTQMGRLHGAAAERGYDHEAVKAHAAADCGVGSTKDLTAHQAAQEITWWETTPIEVVHDRMGDILGAPDEPMADVIDGPERTPTSEIIQPAFSNRAADWEILVREATTQKALYEIGKQIKAAGIDSEELRQAYESKLRAFQAGQ